MPGTSNDDTSQSRGGRQNGQAEANERTPLLNKQNGKDDGHSTESGSQSGSEDQEDDQSLATISNLGDFFAQPKELARIIADKDIDALSNLCNESDGNVFTLLQSDAKQGLQQDQYRENGRGERLRVYGENKLPENELKPFWRFLWEAFNDKVLIILTGTEILRGIFRLILKPRNSRSCR